MEYVVLIVLVVGFALVYIKLNTGNSSSNDKEKIIELEKNLSTKEQRITTLEKNKDVLSAKLESFDQLKTDKTQFEERLKSVENERNQLKTKNTTLEKEEEGRIKEFKKAIDSTNTLQE